MLLMPTDSLPEYSDLNLLLCRSVFALLAFTVSEFVIFSTPKLEQYFVNRSGIFFFEKPAVRWSCPKVGNTCGMNLTAIVLGAFPV